MDAEEALEAKIQKLARTLHGEMFEEEFCFMHDSYADSRDRASGKNPMSQSYIDKVNKKREEFGVSPLSESGEATSSDTYEMCLEIVRRKFGKV